MSYQGARKGKSIWAFRCVCGREVMLAATEAAKQRKRGVMTSCGCKRRETISAKNTTHGMSHHKAFHVWRSMNDRCHLPTHQAWRNYGARGITVCARWRQSFNAFWEDMGPTYREGLTLERLDNSAGYTPENCTWRGRVAQARNKRTNVRVSTPWGMLTAAEAADRAGLNRSTVYYRLAAGVPEHRLLEAPDYGRKFLIW